jgi:hypothetical protein
MCSLSINYYRGCLGCRDIELEGSYMGLMSMELASIGVYIRAYLHHIAKAHTVQAAPF